MTGMYSAPCLKSAEEDFNYRVALTRLPMLQVYGLTLGNAILAGILVVIGTKGTRYRHRPFVRVLFQGANTLFLPILSYVASNASNTVSTFEKTPANNENNTTVSCNASNHLFIVLIWAGLVHMVGICTCTIVAASNTEEGRTMGLPMVLIVQAIWTAYLVVSLIHPVSYHNNPIMYLLPIAFALVYTKMAIRFYEFLKARRSVALGNNPPLIVGYMKQLQLQGGVMMNKHGSGIQPPPVLLEHNSPSPLIVVGEDNAQVEKASPHGFSIKRMCGNQDASNMTGSSDTGLVTMDKVWQFRGDRALISSSTTWRLKQICLSFTLFKLLRCRFAGYTVAEAGFKQVRGFFLHVLLKEKDHESVHGVITDELSFLHDYYYSSIPIHYSNFWLPIINICVSLLTIAYCLLLAGMGVGHFISDSDTQDFHGLQKLSLVYCSVNCRHQPGATRLYHDNKGNTEFFGNILYDVVPVAILLVLVVLAEAKEIATYICSNWTKVALFSRCVVKNHDAWQRSPCMQKWIGRVLRCQCNKLMTHWDDKMYQCSVLVLHPRRTDPVMSLAMRLLRLPDRKKNVKVPGVVKASIFDALISNNGLLTEPKTFLIRILEDDGIGSSNNDFLWACESDSEGISDILLTWHIATSILEMRKEQEKGQQNAHRLSQDMIVATHLSRYCAYLVAYMPELLPDNDEWCKSLYKAVKKDCTRVLDATGASAPTVEATTWYSKLLSLLQEPELEPKHHVVLKNGVKLGKQLVQLRQGVVASWRILTGFWSQMILYIAPADNLKGHAEAIARGGELITMVWALLMNVGIDSRPSSTEDSSPATVDSV